MHWFPAGKGGNDVFACSFSDGTIRVWREALRAPGPAAEAAAVAAAEEGAARWEQRASLRDSATPVCHIGFAPPEYGLQLAASGDDGVVRVWRVPVPDGAEGTWQDQEDGVIAAIGPENREPPPPSPLFHPPPPPRPSPLCFLLALY